MRVENRSTAPTYGKWAPIRHPDQGRRVMTDEHETHDVVVTRRFDAPQERVRRAWSDADDVMLDKMATSLATG